MKILSIHNYYQQRGGEDQVYESEAANLEAHGHQVIRYTAHNDALRRLGSLRAAWTLSWNQAAYREVRSLIRRERPDVCHCHNTFPLISPAVYAAARAEGVPVVQTLHNYRLVCPGATLFRGSGVCQRCVGMLAPWPSIVYGCYRGSRLQTAAVALMLVVHRLCHTWREQVDLFVAPSEFARSILAKGGIGGERIVVKPNHVHSDPGLRTGVGHYALFAGRLAPEKGLWTLLRAWELVPDVPLCVAGDGPLRRQMETFLSGHGLKQVKLLGQVQHSEILELMKGASFLVLPSECFETFSLVAAEAFACGTAVIASSQGALQELVRNGHTGLHFRAGDPADLAAKVTWAAQHPEAMDGMGRTARLDYELKYTASHNHALLLDIYQRAAGRFHQPAQGCATVSISREAEAPRHR